MAVLSADDRLKHEIEFVDKFCAPSRKERYLFLLQSQKGRPKFLSQLYHNLELEESAIVPIPPGLQTVEAIEQELRRLGARENCYCISTNREHDGKFLPLHEALTALVGFGDGTVLSLIPGRLCYYEGEDINSRLILAAAH